MLVLTRKNSQSIRIGDDIVVTVVRIDGSKVRIGIDAPRDMEIRRSELVVEMAENAADGEENSADASSFAALMDTDEMPAFETSHASW